MPYPNYHACRREAPSKFTRIFTKESRIGNKPVLLRIGVDSNNKQQLQSILFPIEHWTVQAAQAKCSGRFEAAKPSKERSKVLSRRSQVQKKSSRKTK